MTQKDALKVLAVLKAAYPGSYNGMTKEEAYGTASVWHLQFANLHVDIVLLALQKAISSNKWPPTVAEVKSKIQALHWEAYDAMNGITGDVQSEESMRLYRYIYQETMEYKHDKFYEPSLNMMLNTPEVLRLTKGEWHGKE